MEQSLFKRILLCRYIWYVGDCLLFNAYEDMILLVCTICKGNEEAQERIYSGKGTEMM